MLRRGFRRTDAGVALRLARAERDILADLLQQLEQLVAPDARPEEQDPLAGIVGIDSHAERPQDPAVLRLFPDAYRDDEAAASDFRRFTEHSLREQKLARARTARATLSTAERKGLLVMSREEGQAWLLALNDIRLAMGTRLGITQDDEDDEDPDRPVVYDWLTWLQSTLIDALESADSQQR